MLSPKDEAAVSKGECLSTPDFRLYDKVTEFEDMFDDMLFKNGTRSYELTLEKTTGEDRKECVQAASTCEELEYFMLEDFNYEARELEGCDGYYDRQNKALVVSVDELENNSTILHEMIHLYESVINELSWSRHDMLIWALYQDLREKIPALDEIVNHHSHQLTQSKLQSAGGNHDLLFLLKSFDLDIRMDYPLGTVFAYGRQDIFKGYSYKRVE